MKIPELPMIPDDEREILEVLAKTLYGAKWQSTMCERLGIGQGHFSNIINKKRALTPDLREQMLVILDGARTEVENDRVWKLMLIALMQSKLEEMLKKPWTLRPEKGV